MQCSIFGREFNLPQVDPKLAGAAAAILGVAVLGRCVHNMTKRWSLRDKRLHKRATCKQALQQLEAQLQEIGISEEQRTAILGLDLPELIKQLQSGELKAVDVLHVYQWMALQVHKKTNCLVEPIWEAEALALACDMDQKKNKPLHGVPVSLKDNYGLEGYDSTIGCSQWIDKPWSEDCVLAQVLKEQGAIPFVKTNVPQTMISYDTTNPIFGQTTHPLDPSRGVGGSSGGEGALIAGGGSILGMGSDIGGSVRIPASMCGICAFKPTMGRISNKGMHPIMKGQNSVCSCYGPMTKDVESLVILMRALLVPRLFELDPRAPPVPFREDMYSKQRPMKIGFYTSDGLMHATPASVRGVLRAKAALEKQGHQVVEWKYPDFGMKVSVMYGAAMAGDKGAEIFKHTKHDATDNALKAILPLFRMPWLLKKLLICICKVFLPKQALLLEVSNGINSVSAWWDYIENVGKFRQEVENSWIEQKLDGMLLPGFTCQALRHGEPMLVPAAVSYTSAYNVLGFPAGSLPVTMVTEGDIKTLKDTYPSSDPWHYIIKKSMMGTQGFPVNVQLAALPYQDEKCLRLMKDLESGLKAM